MASPQWDTLWIDVSLATMTSVEGGAEVEDGALGVLDGRIAWLGARTDLPGAAEELAREVRACNGGWITPGLIDCHTHLVFGGERAGEFEARLEGVSYEEIARDGGGILSTVRATRATTQGELEIGAAARMTDLARDGVTTIEVKSGYDLTLDGELRMLRAARRAGASSEMDVRTTLLALHSLPPEFREDRAGYLRMVEHELLPAAIEQGLADQVDAFIEGVAFTAAECGPFMRAADAAGLGLRVHADQLTPGGGAEAAAGWGARSADHLEHTTEEGAQALAAAGTSAVLLPGAYQTLRQTTPPPVDAFRRCGVDMAVATDLNPGTSPVRSLRMAMNLACVRFGLTPAEALAGVTRVAAAVLGLEADRGTLEVGKRADLAVWAVSHPRELCYWLGGDLLRESVVEGRVRPRA